MVNYKFVMLGTVCLFALGACKTTQDAAVPGSGTGVKVAYEYKRDRVKEQVESIPDWFLKPKENQTNIFSAGTSTTPSMQFAIDAAVLNAKTLLADRINSRLRSQIKQFRAKVGDGDIEASVMTELEKAVKNITANTDVSGYHIANLEVIPHGTQYRAYVLLEYSDINARKILINRLRKNEMLYNKLRVNKAWKDLDDEAEKAQAREDKNHAANLDALTKQ